MNDYKVSIIVPVYNVEKYLERCVRSLRCQTYQNIEIILVDDGSKDNCGIMCDKFALEDTRIKVIHKKNGGLSEARNIGIEKSTGKYLAFVDSDDFVHPSFIETLLTSCLNYNCKISKCNIIVTAEECVNLNDEKLEVRVYSAEEYLQEINRVNGGFSVCNKLFCKSLFQKIRFPLGKLHEDVAVIYKLVAEEGKILEINQGLYFYYNNINSITKSKIAVRRLDDFEFRLELFEFCLKKKWVNAAIKNSDEVYRMIMAYKGKNPDEFQDYQEFKRRFSKVKRKLYWKMFFKISNGIKEKVFYAYKLIG